MVSFIIPVKNDAGRLRRCLASVAASRRGADAEVIVVDNGSTDDSAAVARASGAAVRVVPAGRVSRLRNEGASTARGDLLAFVDADHELGSDWLAAALDAMAPAEVGAAGALYVAPPDGTWVQRTYGWLRGRTVGRAPVRWLGSGNVIVRRAAFAALGGFDETLESCEDVDFCERLRGAGWRLVADERLLSIHHGDPATLATLFRAERWRGRDNLRITLRHGMTARDLPSVLTPVIIAAGALLMVVAAVLLPFVGPPATWVLLGSGAAIAALCLLRGLRIAASAPERTVGALLQALAVGATYELARAAAVVGRAGHHRERSAFPQAARSPIR
jgi:GT2 family glycosyltransferase